MSSYHSNVELAAWQSQLENHARALAAWEQNEQAAEAAWQAAYDAWEAAGAGGDAPKPRTTQPAPVAPEPTLIVYDARLVETAEEVETATGPALVMPGRIVLTGNGVSFALSEGELEHAYTPATQVAPA
jgi:hypothetical protein